MMTLTNRRGSGLLALLLLLPLSLPAQDAPNYETRVHDVSALAAAAKARNFGLRLALAEAFDPQHDLAVSVDDGRTRGWDVDVLADAIRQCTGRGEDSIWDSDERVGIRVNGHRLFVRAPKQVQEEVGAFLAAVRQQVLAPSQAHLYRLAEGAVGATAGGVLPAERVQALVGSEGTHLIAAVHLTDGIPAAAESLRRQSFLADYDVEVANEAQIAVPVIRHLHTGPRFVVGSDRQPDGRCFLRVAGREATLQRLRERDPGATWVGKLQLPTVSQRLVRASGLLGTGEGLLFGGSSEGGHYLLVWTDDLQQADGRLGQRATLFGIGAAGKTLSPLRGPWAYGVPVPLPGTSDQASDFGFEDDCEEGTILIETGEVADFVMGSDPENFDDGYAIVELRHGRLFLTGSRARPDHIRELLSRMHNELTGNALVELRTGTVAASVLKAAMAKGGNLDELAGRLETRVRIPVVRGDGFVWAEGTEESFLDTYYAEIAEKATIADPAIRVRFTGDFFEGRVSRRGQGGFDLELNWSLHLPMAELEVFDPRANDVGELDQSRAVVEAGRTSVALAPATWTVIQASDAPDAPGEGSFVILARVR